MTFLAVVNMHHNLIVILKWSYALVFVYRCDKQHEYHGNRFGAYLYSTNLGYL